MIELEAILQNSPNLILASDEVGRGSLIGQVVSGTVAWRDLSRTEEFINELRQCGVKDSKKVSEKKRLKILNILGIHVETLRPEIVYSIQYKDFNFDFIVSEIDAHEIDKININQATFKCFNNSYGYVKDKYPKDKFHWLIDGDKLPQGNHDDSTLEAIVKGDQKSALIGLAAIIAKEYRDYTVKQLSIKYPMYSWSDNAGYGTQSHMEAMSKFGLCEYHRKSFCKNF